MIRLFITHNTEIEYEDPINASYNEVRMKPMPLPHQQVLFARVDVRPSSYTSEYVDYWGTQVTAFEVLSAHRQMSIIASSRVELHVPDDAPDDVALDVIRSAKVEDEFSEFLQTTPATAVPDEVEDLARASFDGRSPGEAVLAVANAIRDEMEYVPGVTAAQTPATEAWAARKGVCQDISQVTIGALRSVGIPTRYVSGYLYPELTTSLGQTVTGESHAWLEYWTGTWHGFDPTNRRPALDHHVIVARGRQYSDVAPIRGVILGGKPAGHAVTVDITREA